MFKSFGELEKVELQYDDRDHSRGCAYITFVRREDAERAVNRMNGKDVGGKRLRV